MANRWDNFLESDNSEDEDILEQINEAYHLKPKKRQSWNEILASLKTKTDREKNVRSIPKMLPHVFQKKLLEEKKAEEEVVNEKKKAEEKAEYEEKEETLWRDEEKRMRRNEIKSRTSRYNFNQLKKSFNKEYIEDEESDEESDEEIDETVEAIDTPRRMLKKEEEEVMEIMKNPARRKLLQDEFGKLE